MSPVESGTDTQHCFCVVVVCVCAALTWRKIHSIPSQLKLPSKKMYPMDKADKWAETRNDTTSQSTTASQEALQHLHIHIGYRHKASTPDGYILERRCAWEKAKSTGTTHMQDTTLLHMNHHRLVRLERFCILRSSVLLMHISHICILSTNHKTYPHNHDARTLYRQFPVDPEQTHRRHEILTRDEASAPPM